MITLLEKAIGFKRPLPNYTKNQSSPNLHPQANLVTQLLVWTLLMSGWFPKTTQILKVLSWYDKWSQHTALVHRQV